MTACMWHKQPASLLNAVPDWLLRCCTRSVANACLTAGALLAAVGTVGGVLHLLRIGPYRSVVLLYSCMAKRLLCDSRVI